MNENPLISVIVPVYNVENYLPRCLDSVCRQNYRNLEILLIDDGSTDSSGRICDQYRERDGRISVVHKENGGLSSARNAGLEIASGAYVAFVDSDDFIAEDFIQFFFTVMERAGADIVHGLVETGRKDCFSAERAGKRCESFTGPAFLRHYFDRNYKNFGLCVNKLYKRKLFESVRFPEGRVHEDVATVYRLLYAADRVVYTDRVVYYYYMSPESIMRKDFSPKRLDWLTALREKLDFLKEKEEIALYNRSLQEYEAVALKLYYCMRRFAPREQMRIRGLRGEYRKRYQEMIRKKEIGIPAKALFTFGYACPYLAGMICNRMI